MIEKGIADVNREVLLDKKIAKAHADTARAQQVISQQKIKSHIHLLDLDTSIHEKQFEADILRDQYLQ